MIAIDTSALVGFFHNTIGKNTDAVQQAFDQGYGILPPIVLAEMLSDHKLSKDVTSALCALPTLALLNGYWERAGYLRAAILKRGCKARLADTLIAQFCLDHRLALITADTDFRHFQRYGGLKIV